ncbi:MAG: hypothetical protein HY043_18970, partial [Verrucomicrobia bacterium]|nr:hypothetical protein [Verrucomicrobiota bacterium]
AYAVSDLSLKDVAAWAVTQGAAEITGPGLFYRLRESEGWLAALLAQTLQEQVRAAPKGLSLCAVDATVINGPGAAGAEWRVHVRIDPERGTFRSVELTDDRGGEGYGRHPVAAGEVLLGDRAYATARGIHRWRKRAGMCWRGSIPTPCVFAEKTGRSSNCLVACGGCREWGQWILV